MDIYSDGIIYPSEYLVAFLIAVVILIIGSWLTKREEQKHFARLALQQAMAPAELAAPERPVSSTDA